MSMKKAGLKARLRAYRNWLVSYQEKLDPARGVSDPARVVLLFIVITFQLFILIIN